MVKRDLVGQKHARAVAWLDDAQRRLSRPKDVFLSDADGRDLAMFHLFLAMQECVDLAAHWIADDGLPPADDYAGAFEVLRAQGRIPTELAASMVGATGLRNRIAHGYGEVDAGRVYDEATAGILAIRQFLAAVAKAAGL